MGTHRRIIRNNVNNIEKSLRKFQRRVGDTVLWLEYDSANSTTTDTYTEGAIPDPFDPSNNQPGPGIVYKPPKPLPAVWVRYHQPTNVFTSEGEYTPSSLDFRAARTTMVGLGLLTPLDPAQHFNDRFSYRGKVYRVDSYKPTGWMAGTYLMLDVGGTEVMPDELMTDLTPPIESADAVTPWTPGQRLDWPAVFPNDWGTEDSPGLLAFSSIDGGGPPSSSGLGSYDGAGPGGADYAFSVDGGSL